MNKDHESIMAGLERDLRGAPRRAWRTLMIAIDGLAWFLGALVVCGAHVLHLRGMRRERLSYLAWWRRYDETSQERHDELMQAIARGEGSRPKWRLNSSSNQRGQA